MRIIRTAYAYSAITLLACLLVSCGSNSNSASNSDSSSNLPVLNADILLSDLTIAGVELDQTFQPTQSSYTGGVHFLTSSIGLLPVASDSAATITVNGIVVASSSDFTDVSLVEGDNLIDVVVNKDNAVSTYTFEISRATAENFAQQAYQKASNAESDDNFGSSVAIDGDTMVVGAPFESGDSGSTVNTPNDNASSAGAAYVFIRVGDSWVQQGYLKASNAGGGDLFGLSVSVSGDTVVVGAFREDGDSTSAVDTPNENTSASGAAYVFTRDSSVWTQQAYLKASNADAGDEFGRSVGVNGNTVVVGARYESGDTSSTVDILNNKLDAGAAYVFVRDGESWTQQAYLKASNADAGDQFGQSVAVSGDTVVVGAINEEGDSDSTIAAPNDNTSDAGAAYVFTRDGTGWTQQGYLKAGNVELNYRFGFSVAVSGNTVVVGAREEDGDSASTMLTPNDDAINSGAAYVFTRDGTSWSQQAYLKASNAGAGDSFGYSVAVSGDTVVVGASSEGGDSASVIDTPNNDAFEAGAAYVFTRDGISWTQQFYLKASNAAAADLFGASVAVSGDTVVVGANDEGSSTTGGESDNSESKSGAVYVWQ